MGPGAGRVIATKPAHPHRAALDGIGRIMRQRSHGFYPGCFERDGLASQELHIIGFNHLGTGFDHAYSSRTASAVGEAQLTYCGTRV